MSDGEKSLGSAATSLAADGLTSDFGAGLTSFEAGDDSTSTFSGSPFSALDIFSIFAFTVFCKNRISVLSGSSSRPSS